jgi:methionine-rich copper-binding protein CopC
MKRTALAVGLALSIALPAGLASAKIGRSTPAAHPRVSTGAKSKSIKAGKSSARVQTRRSRASVRKPKGSARKTRQTKARTATGSMGRVDNPSAGSLRVGTRQRPSERTGITLGGNAGGNPINTRLGT